MVEGWKSRMFKIGLCHVSSSTPSNLKEIIFKNQLVLSVSVVVLNVRLNKSRVFNLLVTNFSREEEKFL